MLLHWRNKFVIIIVKIVLKSFNFLGFHVSVRHQIFISIPDRVQIQAAMPFYN